MKPTFVLRSFGVIHMDDPEKVTRELGAFAEGADAVFIEYPRDPISVRELLVLLLRVPTYVVGLAALQIAMYSPLYVLFNRDLFPTELVAARSLADDRDLPLHAVDEHPNRRLLDAGVGEMAVNWLLLAPAVALAPLLAPAAALLLVVGGFLPLYVRRSGYRRTAIALVPLGFGCLLAAVFLTWWAAWLFVAGGAFATRTLQSSIDHRNDVMLDRVQELRADNGYDDAVLVTGKAHLGGVVAGAFDRGFDVATAHVSNWREPGRTHETVDRDRLDELDLPDAEDYRTTPDVVEGSERTVFPRRVGAALLDLVFGGVFWFLCVLLLVAAREEGAIRATDETLFAGFLAAWAVSFFALAAVQEWRRGATVGKYLLGLVVVDETGDLPSRRAAALRNLPRPLGALVGYAVGGVAALASENNRTVGDRLAGTYVCRRAPADEE